MGLHLTIGTAFGCKMLFKPKKKKKLKPTIIFELFKWNRNLEICSTNRIGTSSGFLVHPTQQKAVTFKAYAFPLYHFHRRLTHTIARALYQLTTPNYNNHLHHIQFTYHIQRLFNTIYKRLTSFGKSHQTCCSIHLFCRATTLGIGSFRAQVWPWW